MVEKIAKKIFEGVFNTFLRIDQEKDKLLERQELMVRKILKMNDNVSGKILKMNYKELPKNF